MITVWKVARWNPEAEEWHSPFHPRQGAVSYAVGVTARPAPLCGPLFAYESLELAESDMRLFSPTARLRLYEAEAVRSHQQKYGWLTFANGETVYSDYPEAGTVLCDAITPLRVVSEC